MLALGHPADWRVTDMSQLLLARNRSQLVVVFTQMAIEIAAKHRRRLARPVD
jgi:hypothetical protein